MLPALRNMDEDKSKCFRIENCFVGNKLLPLRGRLSHNAYYLECAKADALYFA